MLQLELELDLLLELLLELLLLRSPLLRDLVVHRILAQPEKEVKCVGIVTLQESETPLAILDNPRSDPRALVHANHGYSGMGSPIMRS